MAGILQGRIFFFLKYKDWQMLGEIKDFVGRVSFPILLLTTLSTGNAGKPQIGDCGLDIYHIRVQDL